jgi:hypothetical protein
MPRAGESFSHEIRFSFIDRFIQKITDKVNLGGTYKLYRIKCNLELLCKEPGNWEGDARNFSELTDLIKPYSASNAKNKDLENVLSSFSEDLLAQGFSSLKELDEKIARGGRSGTCGEETQIKYLKEEFKEHGMGNIAEKTVSFLKLPLSPEKAISCNVIYYIHKKFSPKETKKITMATLKKL